MDTTIASRSSHEPQLAPPGAGLPAVELFIGRILFAITRLRGCRESHNARFQRERGIMRDLTRGLDTEAAARRVLIARPPGLEDSSRHWSVLMVFDHLRIMNHAMGGVIRSLGSGIVPQRKASTANVKPSPDVDASVIAAYEQSCDDLLAAVASVRDLKTAARFDHPWFGPLDAAGWHAMAAMHMGLHRVQVERILEGLDAARG